MSKTRNSLVFSALVAAIALSVPATGALAKPGAGGLGGMSTLAFEHFDQDADGSLTKEELRDVGGARFNQMDANGDGELSADELEAAAEARRAARFGRMIERLDTDGNGTVSAEEMAAAHDKMGKRGKTGRDHAHGDKRGDKRGGDARHAEHDRDGRMQRGGEERRAERDGKRAGGEERREQRADRRAERLFALIDTDGNGTVSQAEFDSAKDRLAAARRTGPAPTEN